MSRFSVGGFFQGLKNKASPSVGMGSSASATQSVTQSKSPKGSRHDVGAPSTVHYANTMKLCYTNFHGGDPAGQLELKAFAHKFGIALNNPWLPQFGHLCDRNHGTEVGLAEFVMVMGTLGQQSHETPQEAEAAFVWRLLDLDDQGKLTRAEMSARMKSIYVGKTHQNNLFVIEKNLPIAPMGKGDFATFYMKMPSNFSAIQALWRTLEKYMAPCTAVLGHVCGEIGPRNLVFRKLYCRRMQLDVADVAVLIELDQKMKDLALHDQDRKVPESILQDITRVFQNRFQEPSAPEATTNAIGQQDMLNVEVSNASLTRKKRLGVQGDTTAQMDDEIPEVPKSKASRALIRRAFEGCLLFDDISEDVMEKLIGSMDCETCPVGTEIIHQGDPDAEMLYVIEAGHCGVFFKDENGEVKRVNDLGAGRRFGDVALLYTCPRNATVRVEKAVTLWRLQRNIYNSVNIMHAENMQRHKEELVENVPLFQWLHEEHRRTLVDALVPAQFKDSEILMRKGDIGDIFYIIDKGVVSVLDGDMELVKLHSGASFGERALIMDDKRSATIKAASPVSCLTLQRSTIVSLLGPLEDMKRWCVLRKTPMMSFLSNEDIHKLVSVISHQTLGKDAVLFRAGDPVDSMYFVYTGELILVDEKAKQDTTRLRRGSAWRETGELMKVGVGGVVGDEGLMFHGSTERTLTCQVSGNGAAEVLRLDVAAVARVIGTLDDLQSAWRMNIVSTVPIFTTLTSEAKKEIVNSMVVDQVEDGVLLSEEGDTEILFSIVQFGTLACSKNGKEVRRIKAGEYFGEEAVFGNECTETWRSIGQAVVASVPSEVMQNIGDDIKEKFMALGGNAAAASQLSNKLHLKDLSGVKRLKVIGIGGFGLVCLVKIDGKVYAMKMLLKDHVLSCKMAPQVNAEREIGMNCDSTFMVNLYGTFRDSRYLYMFMEPVLGGELFSFVENHRKGNRGLEEKQARFFAACVVLGLEYLHNRNVVYRDLKLENLLIDAHGYVKIADFGFAKILEGKTYTVCGTPEYMAPEIITRKGHGKGVDIWALGVLIFELMCRWTPFSRAGDDMAIMNMIKKGEFQCPSYLPKDCVDLVRRMLNVNVSERLGCLKNGIGDIKSHKWFAGFDWDALANRKLVAPWIPNLKSPEDISNLDPFDQNTPHPGQRAAKTRRNSEGIFDHW